MDAFRNMTKETFSSKTEKRGNQECEDFCYKKRKAK